MQVNSRVFEATKTRHLVKVTSFPFRDFLVPLGGEAVEDMSWRLWDVETTTELLLQDAGFRGEGKGKGFGEDFFVVVVFFSV